MIEIDTNKEVNAAQRTERLKEFAAAVSRFEAAQLRQLFVQPQRGYKKILAGLDAESKRAYENAQEEHMRSETARKDFEKLSVLALAVFPDLKLPILNRELRAIIMEALESHLVLTHDKSAPLKIRALNIRKSHVAEEAIVVPPKDKGEMDEPVKAVQGMRVAVDLHPVNSHADKNESNILPIVDSIEMSILEGVKKFGFTRIDKTDTTRRFVKDEQTYFDVEKNGAMYSNNYAIDGDEKHTIDGIVNSTLAMVEIYLQVANKHGNDLAFPQGAINVKTDLSPNAITPENKEKVDHITSIIRIKVTEALRDEKYDGIRSRILYQGQAITADSAKTRMLKKAYPPTENIHKKQVLDRAAIKQDLYTHRMGNG